MRVNIGGTELGSLQLLVDIAVGHLLTVLRQLVVESEAAIRRSVCSNLYILHVQALAILVDLLEHLDELLDRVVLQLALAEVGLVDEELDVGLNLLILDALETVGRDAGTGIVHGLLVEFRSSDDTIGDLHGRHIVFLVALACVEGEIHLACLHIRIVGEGSLHGVLATHLVRNRLVVALYFLTLESSALAFGYLTVAITKFRCYGDRSFLLHIFYGERTVDSSGNLAADGSKRVGIYREVIGRKRTHLRA